MIEPISGFLVDVDVAARVVAKPFDQLTRVERHAHARADELSFLNVIDHPSGETARGAHHLEQMIETGVFLPQPVAFYAYQVTYRGLQALGLVGSMPPEFLGQDRLRGHESVHPDDVRSLQSFFEQSEAQSSPIALTCKTPHSLRALLDLDRHPNLSIDTGTYQAAVWAITDEHEVGQIRSLCSQQEQLYITDGHHRVTALREMGAPALVMLFSPDELTVLPFQRIVRGGATLLNSLGPCLGGDAEPYSTPSVVHDGTWNRLVLPSPSDDLIEGLDVVRLHMGVLESLGIDAEHEHLEYVAVPAFEIEEHMQPGDLGFTLDPVDVDTVLAAADDGRLMPPKTTNFAPKPRSGVFVMRM